MSIKGIVATVPENTEYNSHLSIFEEWERNDIIQKVGINSRRVAPAEICASDLCLAAAKQLLALTQVEATAIGIVVFVTQTPDHLLPGNSMLVQKKLGLSSSTLLLDINQGCAGYIYGLSIITGMMHAAHIDYGMLLVGDTITRLLSPFDRTTLPIFSDAGSATLIQRTETATPVYFNIGADGNGFNAIYIKDGGTRHPYKHESLNMVEEFPGVRRTALHLTLEGVDVLNYTLKNVVPNVKALLGYAGIDTRSVNYFIFHQANRILNENITKRLGIPSEKAPETLSAFGNTSSATIPLTICHRLGNILTRETRRMILSGFGVGFSWGSALMDTQLPIHCELLEIRLPDEP